MCPSKLLATAWKHENTNVHDKYSTILTLPLAFLANGTIVFQISVVFSQQHASEIWEKVSNQARPCFFKSWIAPSTGLITVQRINIKEKCNCVIHWIEIYPEDSVIYLLNNWGKNDNGIPT